MAKLQERNMELVQERNMELVPHTLVSHTLVPWERTFLVRVMGDIVEQAPDMVNSSAAGT